MDKLVRRTAEAQRRVVRRAKRFQDTEYRGSLKRRLQEEGQTLGELRKDVKDARKARAEAWDLGPLAKRRDQGMGTFGAMETARYDRRSSLKEWEIDERCKWAGGSQYLCLQAKDRVVVLDGPYKGKIDRIADIRMSDATVSLESVGKALVALSPAIRAVMGSPPSQATNYRIPISAIRLVHPLTDPKTGLTRDVIIRELARGQVKWDRHIGWCSYSRHIPGLNVTIPWPERQQPSREDQKGDTLRIHVEQQTFVPSLIRPPMPASLINELRNQYSKFRTRHDEDYVARKEAEQEAKKARIQSIATMRTPVQELNYQQRAKRRALGQPVLTPEMLEKIGQVIARNKAATLSAAGMSEVTSGHGSAAPPPPV